MEKTVSESRMEQVYQVRPEHLNGAGRLFGGRLMEWIDELAGFVGIRHAQQDVITASVDNLRFIRGAYQVPRLILETEAERAEWEAGIKRREMRDRRRAEGF